MSARPSPSALLRPSRALLHPLWLGSLAVLVLNDHVLKGASILPDAVTGKLSDFAGLMVAPVLLAMLTRVRTRRGLALAHVAVGVVFAGIQLSVVAAAQWSAAMESIGFPWVITRDATDLIALPALLVSMVVLGAGMRRPVPSPARRSAELMAAGTGLLCCAATSPPPGEPFRSDLWTDVYVHNAGDQALVVRFRSLSPSVDLDCNAVADDPGGLITEPLFGDAQSFLLDPDQNLGLRLNNEWDDWGDDSSRGCFAVLLDIDGMPPAVAFWQHGSVPLHTVPAEGYTESPNGGIDLQVSDTGDTLGTYETMGTAEVLHLVPPAAPPVDGACAPQSDATRLEWSEPVPIGTWELLDVDLGADGCFGLDLGTRSLEDEPTVAHRWYLCAPLSDLGIEIGRQVRVEMLSGAGSEPAGVSLSTTGTAGGVDTVQLTAYRGETFPAFHGLQIAAVPEFECGHVVGERCGTITRATAVTAGGGDFDIVELLPGASQTLQAEDDRRVTIAVAHAEERAALDSECAEGPDDLGLDLEIVTLYTEPNPG